MSSLFKHTHTHTPVTIAEDTTTNGPPPFPAEAGNENVDEEVIDRSN